MLNDLQAPIEHEEEIEKFRLEDEMPMNVRLMHVKVLNGWSNKSFDMLLELLRATFPMCNSTIPSSFYEAKRKLRDLGLGYETIHACKYDCVLYWKEFVDLQHCSTCGETRYKEGSADMRWHRDKRVETDDVLRLQLMQRDGFNPFGQMSTSYSMWSVVLLPYNLLPWKCMKETNFFMSLLIPGPNSPGREIDVYLQPLIEELKELWTFGVRSYDFLTGYKSLNTSRFWYMEEPVILATQAHQVFYVDDPKNGSNWKVVQVIQNKRIWDVPEVKNVQNDHINILEVVVSHQVDDHIKDDTLCRNDVDPTIVERPVVCHVTDDFIDDFEDDLDNIAGGSSSVGDNTGSSSQQKTPTPRRRAQSRLLELERHVAINGRIPMTIAPGAEKPISPYIVRFSQAIGVCVRKTFPVCCLKWADVGREYIERLFVLDFNDQAMNRFVEHQILTTFKEFRTDCHRHFKKYSDPEEARANPPNALDQSRTNKAARQNQPYNHSSGSKSFLQRQYELAERRGQPVDRVELFRETHVRAGTFVSQAAEDVHNQMLEFQSQPTLEGSQPLSEDEICDQVLGRRPGYSKDLGWGPKPKARRTASASSSSTSCSQSTKKEIELQDKLHEAFKRIKVQDRNHQALASQVEAMKKMIELTRAQQGPPHDP
ncbi:CACTA en-spm transposon protein [Cucumis melo var. makuwa]|uniref:CACTA en-spm transposon protein n=1 Tax=Cucumis melo var. makuwa TaxID=1194695 RepID=A0A5A7UBN3_CUCMM|nr:CACTA en-spm transposon protein [Cucumis melo var. makuwa]